jgi:hypothetical protein
MPSTRMWIIIAIVILAGLVFVIANFVAVDTAPSSDPGHVDGPLDETTEAAPESAEPH